MNRQDFNKAHSRCTKSFKDFIQQYEKSLSPEVFEKFLSSVDHELKLAKDQISSVPEGKTRAQRLQELVDIEIQKETDLKVSCFKGCSACCHMEVEITNYESEVLSELVQKGHSINREVLKEQSLREVQDKKWSQRLSLSANRCVFLAGDGACSIYENRPVMCRRHSVTSPPINCESMDLEIGVRFFPRVDLLITAANEDKNLRIGPLAKMLQVKLIENESKRDSI
jgi:Fe-S-cluster containining protein